MNLPTPLKGILLGATCTLISNASFAEADPFTPGFSGGISLNVGVGESQSQSSTHDDNAITDDLHNSGKTVESASPFILGRLQYSFGNTLIFLGNSEDQIAEAQFQAEVGVAHRLNKQLTLTAALFGNLPGLDEVWQDPYLTNQKRETTEQSVAGIRFALDINSALPITLKYAVASSEVEKDQIGTSQSLTADENSLLDRESNYQRFGTEMAIPFSPSFVLAPALYYTTRDAKGDANSFDEISAQLSIVLDRSQHNLVTTLRGSKAEFDSENPVFNLKRDYDSLSVFSIYSYSAPFNWRNIQLHVMAGYQSQDSNINFYDSDNTFVSTGFSYRF
ncbi:DUF2860 family protein [Vibrio genomosp. F10]|uniref:DUF2860 family protein n=1 Tax=Vibrio genomosp. F10 TaxID=723171 RepID=UPI00031B3AEC|nr:DUF2860 family protein [Vibrio genomosp. F10]OEF07753.1 hypothetical protein A1QI_17035 [Vibrio genomosp. F10 str. 9ZB36]